MSRAVVTCCSAGRPCGLMKWVCAMPRRAAVWFICLTNDGLVAAERLGDGDGDVVGGAHDERVQRLVEGDVLAGLEAEAGRRLLVGGGRDEDLRLLRRPLVADGGEHEVGRHHLGERGGIPRRIEVLGVEDVAVLEVEHQAVPAAAGWTQKAQAASAAVNAIRPSFAKTPALLR